MTLCHKITVTNLRASSNVVPVTVRTSKGKSVKNIFHKRDWKMYHYQKSSCILLNK